MPRTCQVKAMNLQATRNYARLAGEVIVIVIGFDAGAPKPWILQRTELGVPKDATRVGR